MVDRLELFCLLYLNFIYYSKNNSFTQKLYFHMYLPLVSSFSFSVDKPQICEASADCVVLLKRHAANGSEAYSKLLQ